MNNKASKNTHTKFTFESSYIFYTYLHTFIFWKESSLNLYPVIIIQVCFFKNAFLSKNMDCTLLSIKLNNSERLDWQKPTRKGKKYLACLQSQMQILISDFWGFCSIQVKLFFGWYTLYFYWIPDLHIKNVSSGVGKWLYNNRSPPYILNFK